MILGGQFQSLTDIVQTSSISKVPGTKGYGSGPSKVPEDIRQCTLNATRMLRCTLWYIKVSEMKNNSCNILHWDLFWKCWGCVYGGREEKKAVSRFPLNTTTWQRIWEAGEDRGLPWLKQLWNIWSLMWNLPNASFKLPTHFQQRIGSETIIGELGLASDNMNA